MNTNEYKPPYKNARVIAVIETTLTTRGEGKNENDPIREIVQYWTLEGQLIAEKDPLYVKRSSQ